MSLVHYLQHNAFYPHHSSSFPSVLQMLDSFSNEIFSQGKHWLLEKYDGQIGPGMNTSDGNGQWRNRPSAARQPIIFPVGPGFQKTPRPKYPGKNRGYDQRIVNGKVADKNQFPYQVLDHLFHVIIFIIMATNW